MDEQGQGKRLFLTILLCVGIFGAGQYFFGETNKPAAPVAAAPQAGSAAAVVPAAPVDPAAAAAAAPPAEVKPRGAETFLALESEKYIARISSYGGALSNLTLKGSQYTEQVTGTKDRTPMDLVRPTGPASYAYQVTMPGSTFAIPADSEWTLAQTSPTEIQATWRSSELEVVKSFKMIPGHYALELAVAVTNRSQAEATQRLAVEVVGFEDPSQSGTSGFLSYQRPVWQASCLVNGELKNKHVKDLFAAPAEHVGSVRWAGMNHKYFLLAVAPQPGQDPTARCESVATASELGRMRTVVTLPEWKLKPGDTAVRKFVAYAGPKNLDQLEAMGVVQGGDNELAKAVDWGTAPLKWFSAIARPMLSLLKIFQSWVHNWGIAIILLTITIKLLTLYWTHKSMKSMRAMGRIKPEMDALKDKYPDDRQRQQQEMMNLYKQHKINPLGGCLPMLLQAPIWMALYSALSAAAELYQAPFFGWLNDLTAPDQYHVIPVVLMVLMFLQSKLTPTAVDSQQQKILTYMMPLMIGAFALLFPAGLAVYMLTNQILSMGHQIYLNKSDPMPVAPQKSGVAAAIITPAKSGSGGGKGGSGGNKGGSGKGSTRQGTATKGA